MSIEVLCLFFDLIICFSCIEFEKFFVDLGYQAFFFLKDFIYLFMRDSQREAEGEAGSPLSREPDAGLHPRTLGW